MTLSQHVGECAMRQCFCACDLWNGSGLASPCRRNGGLEACSTAALPVLPVVQCH
eukprot:m.188326 g.188326  ORF g.188326 m.188326 type:complete len:55 (+) comp17384_c0_seq1:3582-3746(+)